MYARKLLSFTIFIIKLNTISILKKKKKLGNSFSFFMIFLTDKGK